MNAPFAQPHDHFSQTDAGTIGDMIANASDVAVIIDRQGIVRDVAGVAENLSRLGTDRWIGHPLEDLVAADSRRKISEIVDGKTDGGGEHLVSHQAQDGETVVIRYTAVSTGSDRPILLLGRDLSPLRTLQDRILSSQQTIEQSLERQRQDEARYRTLFQIASDAVIIVHASGAILEINQAASDLLGLRQRSADGKQLSGLFTDADATSVEGLLHNAADKGAQVSVEARLASSGLPLSLRATPYRSGEATHILIQLAKTTGSDQRPPEQTLLHLVRQANEAIVVTDDSGVIVWANESFVDFAQSGSVEMVLGQPLAAFFDPAEMDIGIVLTNVRQHRRLRMLPARMVGSAGQTTDVELSIVTMPDATPPGFGVVIRNVSLRTTAPIQVSAEPREAANPVEHLVGKVPLKELVRDEIDAVEKNCIEVALNLTGNNRAATAKVLGLSRQGLYTKMRRYGLISGDE